MIALCVDDEYLPLEALRRAVEKSGDVTEVHAFEDELEALAWAEDHPVDIAFLDIELHEMNGIQLAEKLARIHPKISVVFCTSYEQYAVEAIGLHMDVGYLIKPFRASQVQDEIDHVKEKRFQDRKLRVICFGEFTVYAGEQPLEFRRTKTKELFAYLIDRRGSQIGASQLCLVLWENENETEKQLDYLYHLISDLKTTLAKAGAADGFHSGNRGDSINPAGIDCDYYQMLDQVPGASGHYTGEYMNQYSWAESTNAWLAREFGSGKRFNHI